MALTASMTRARKIAGTRHLFSKENQNQNSHYAPRPKRQLDPSERDRDNIVAKKAKLTTGIAVEIPARSSLHARFAKDAADTVDNAGTSDTSDANSAPAPPKPAVAAPNAPTSHRAPPSKANGPKPAPATTQQQQRRRPAPAKHQSKVAKGLKHELDRLQPNEADTKDQGRKLRSQEVIRFKSELSSYFPEYDEVIGNDPKETHFLNIDTPIVIIPDPSYAPNTNTASPHHYHQQSQQPQPHPTSSHPRQQHDYPTRSYGDALYTDLFDAQRIDFSFLSNPTPPTSDPLPDTLFAPAHKKAERTERSIRNTEKGRAQHERDQIVRLLDGLQGHDWLRVMGVSGVTETKKRAFEPARDHFIRGCEAILEKFRRWTREEKKRRAEMLERRMAFLSGGEGVETGDEEEEDGEDEEDEMAEVQQYEKDAESGGEEDEDVEREPPDESDVDASIAKQLREEALAAAAKKRRAKAGGKAAAAKRTTAATRGKAAAASSSHPPEEKQPREIVSLFRKRYQREAALSTNRRKGRTVLAWGEPIPDMEEAEFELPAELRADPTFQSPGRKKRRNKRVKE